MKCERDFAFFFNGRINSTVGIERKKIRRTLGSSSKRAMSATDESREKERQRLVALLADIRAAEESNAHILGKIDGIERLKRRVEQDMNGLQRVKSSAISNYNFFRFVWTFIINCANFDHSSGSSSGSGSASSSSSSSCCFASNLIEWQRTLIVESVFIKVQDTYVDVQARDSARTFWIKLKARKPAGVLSNVVDGVPRSVVGIAKTMVSATVHMPADNEHLRPLIVFCFKHNVDEMVRRKLVKAGALVSMPCDDVFAAPVCARSVMVMLDTSLMLTYVSELSNMSEEQLALTIPYRQKALAEQLAAERAGPRPLRSIDAYLHDKQLHVCQSARESFELIVSKVAGDNERERAARLLERCKFIDDGPCERFLARIGGHNSAPMRNVRNTIVYATAAKHGMAVATSNSGFVRAAREFDLHLVARCFPSRALTEQYTVAQE
jgi:Protein of unknown function (DUF1308)